jgi:hypothetical protein
MFYYLLSADINDCTVSHFSPFLKRRRRAGKDKEIKRKNKT